ncbi:MAG TPA: hypothetical protein DCS93_12435 [Microscillaceae bacterium]|nr:hypothetical protein [Microscillaceae bacterium]
MRSFIILGVLLSISWNSFSQTQTYAHLYKLAFHESDHRPDLAISYAQKALKEARNRSEKANAHYLVAFYAQYQGYYGLAIIHYNQAFRLYTTSQKKTTILNNMATCYKQAGKTREAIKIGRQVSKRFAQQQDTVKFSYTINLLANCYRDLANYNQSDSLFRFSMQLTKRFVTPNLPNVYQDYACLQERLGNYSNGIRFLKQAIALSDTSKPIQKKIRLTQLARMYLHAKKLDSAGYFLDQAISIPQRSLKSTILLSATEGLFHFINRNEQRALKSYHQCDSLLSQLHEHTSHLVQKKYARKTAYEVYQQAYKLLNNLWFFGNKERFEQPKNWFKQRMNQEKALYEGIQVSVALKDSLVIARSAPKTQVVRQINPWWWALMVAVVVAGGWLLYRRREKALQAQTDYVKAIKTSPIKGFDEPKPQEIAVLQQVETRVGQRLKIDEIKILLMIGRGYTYNQITLATYIPNGTIKTIVKRLKDQCGVENIRDLM